MPRILPVLALALVLGACDSTGADDGAAPALIAPAAFALDADAFPQDNARSASGSAGPNFVNAAARVGIVSAVVGANLALPRAATEAATRSAPVVTDGVFAWSSTVDVFGTPVDLRLEADPDGDAVGWRLVSTRQGAEPFTYYTATTSADGRRGTWRLFHPDADGAVLTADFDVRDLDDREVTFRVPTGRDNGGSSVRYATDGDEQTFDWDDQPEDDRALIVWDRATNAGSITADTFNGGDRACWDRQLRDTDC